MDRVKALRVDAGGPAGDSSTLSDDAGFETAEDTLGDSTKYLSFAQDESVTPQKAVNKDVAICGSTPRPAVVDPAFGTGLSPISQTDGLGYAIGAQIDAKNILSGGVDIFEDCISNDGDGLVIDDDAVAVEDAVPNEDAETKPPYPVNASDKVICERNESADLSVSGDGLLTVQEIARPQQSTECSTEEVRKGTTADDIEPNAENAEIKVNIDGKEVDALGIGHGLYMYRKTEGGELNAFQMIEEEGQAPVMKFLKVRQIGSNLELYEEQILEVPITSDELAGEKVKEKIETPEVISKSSHLPISDVKAALSQDNNKIIANSKSGEENMKKINTPEQSTTQIKIESNYEKKINTVKTIESSRKSPILGNFTTMTVHSSSNRDGVPSKSMINFPLNCGRTIDTAKKIEVATDKTNLKNYLQSTSSFLANTTPPLSISKTSDSNFTEMYTTTEQKKGLNSCGQVIQCSKDNEKKIVTKSEADMNECVKDIHLPQEKRGSIQNLVSKRKSSDSNKLVETLTNCKSQHTETKKDAIVTKPHATNVVSKWVLRSDHCDDKSKKDKEICTADNKHGNNNSNKYPHSIVSKEGSKDLIQYLSTERAKRLNTVQRCSISADTAKETLKEETKVGTEIIPLVRSSIPEVKKSVIPTNEHYKNKVENVTEGVKNIKAVEKKLINIEPSPGTSCEKNIVKDNVKKETSLDYMNKYISEAFKNVPFQSKDNSRTNVNDQSKLNIASKGQNSSINTNLNQQCSNIKAEQSSKPVPFGKWTEGDKQQYLNKLKEKRNKTSSPTLTPAQSLQLVTANIDLKKQELGKTVVSFERTYMPKLNTDLKATQPEEKHNRDVDMKEVIDVTIQGIIMKTLLGPAGQPPVINHPKIKSVTPENKVLTNKEPQKSEIGSSLVNSTCTINQVTEQVKKSDVLKDNKIPKLLPINANSACVENKNFHVNDNITKSDEDDSDEEIIDNEPVTGDMQWPAQAQHSTSQVVTVQAIQKMVEAECTKNKAANIKTKNNITENDFDNFVRRNSSSSSEACKPIQSELLIDTDHLLNKKLNHKNDIKSQISNNKVQEKAQNKFSDILISKPSGSSHKQITNPSVKSFSSNSGKVEVPANISKVQMAYQSALTAMNQRDLPPKSVENNSQLPKLNATSPPNEKTCTDKTLQTDKMNLNEKNHEKSGAKIKHPRKQVLTPVDSPPIEVLECFVESDNVTEKKRRKIEQKTQQMEIEPQANTSELKITPRKDYILGRTSSLSDEIKKVSKSAVAQPEEKMEEINLTLEQTPKRGRGRPRKNPTDNQLDESIRTHTDSVDNSQHSSVDSLDSGCSDEEGIIRENWTMGKINDSIICPICSKLFRSESIVFKHVKHCSSLNKSPLKRAATETTMSSLKKSKTESSQEETHVKNDNVETSQENTTTPSKNNSKSSDVIILDTPIQNKVIVIEDTPLSEIAKGSIDIDEKEPKIEKVQNKFLPVKSKSRIVSRPRSVTTHTCDTCGKTFRQLSYLVHHKLQHKNSSKQTQQNEVQQKPILSCEICNKEFRKLHHLVEHREIHNSNPVPVTDRKTSVDKSDSKPEILTTAPIVNSKSEEHTAGFRCEPCDKSFRKLHHLVEHRETHDGVHKQKVSPPQPAAVSEKSSNDSPTCEVCGKSFRKLHHLIEHREQHTEAYQEKKERKSSLVAKDIIHECSLCYMVFPNEPSLNKHLSFCLKKKKQSITSKDNEQDKDLKISQKTQDSKEVLHNSDQSNAAKPASILSKRSSNLSTVTLIETSSKNSVVTKTTISAEPVLKKAAKVGTAAKRTKSSLDLAPEDSTVKTKDSDDEARYMINPSYQPDSDEEEIFMNICVTKRNSLQFDSPKQDTEIKTRRTSLQHPDKSQKGSLKKIDKIPANLESGASKTIKLEHKQSNAPLPPIKLKGQSRAKLASPKSQNKSGIQAPKNNNDKKVDKRKSLSGIAKRKSLGKSVASATKKDVKRIVNHVCDCGAPFSSATLLAQHTSVAHTPPRIRKPRTDPPARSNTTTATSTAKKRTRVTKHSGVPVAIRQTFNK